MVKNITITRVNLLYLFFSTLYLSCGEEKLQGLDENGCNDPLAINYNINSSTQSTGECKYSSVIFYGLAKDSLRYPVKITFDNEELDTLILNFSVGVVPQNCIDGINGTKQFEFTNSETLGWVATIKANDEKTDSLIFSGKIVPNSIQDCIQVNIINP